MKKNYLVLLLMMIVPSLCAMEQPRKKQKIECSVNPFDQLPKEIIMHIFCFAMPVLQNKEHCKNENWEDKKVFDMPEEFFAPDLVTYKNVSASCKQLNQLLLKDEGIVNLMKYFKKQKEKCKEIRQKLKHPRQIAEQAGWTDDWDAFDW